MRIEISGVEYAPTWVSLQSVIRESLNLMGKLTRIARNDNNCSYRDKGEYSLVFTPDSGDNISIQLVIK